MKKGVLAQITDLQRMTHPELLERWRSLYGSEPPSYNRPHLIKRLAYRVQELAYGGLSDFARAELRRHIEAEGLDIEKAEGARLERRRRKDGIPVIGAQLAREWNGGRYVVSTAVENRGIPAVWFSGLGLVLRN